MLRFPSTSLVAKEKHREVGEMVRSPKGYTNFSGIWNSLIAFEINSWMS